MALKGIDMNNDNIEKLINQLKRHEGLRIKPYKCTANKTSIGYGRNLDDNGISIYEAEMLLQNDVNHILRQLETVIWYMLLDDVRKAVIVNMAYNMGIQGMLGFKKMIAAIQKQDWETVAKEMLDSDYGRELKTRATELSKQLETGKWQ